MKKKKRSVKIRLEIVPPQDIKWRAEELGMTSSEFVNYQAKKHRLAQKRKGRSLKTFHTQLNHDFDNFDWKKWKYGD